MKRKIGTFVIASTLAFSAFAIVPEEAHAKSFKNCTELNKV